MSNSGKTTVLQLGGKFVFDCHRKLRAACETVLAYPAIEVIQLEISQVEYVDSSGLGMMLLMKEKGGSAGKTVQIKGAQGLVRRILEVAKFDLMFDMQP